MHVENLVRSRIVAIIYHFSGHTNFHRIIRYPPQGSYTNDVTACTEGRGKKYFIYTSAALHD